MTIKTQVCTECRKPTGTDRLTVCDECCELILERRQEELMDGDEILTPEDKDTEDSYGNSRYRDWR